MRDDKNEQIISLIIRNLGCASCAVKMEDGIRQLPGVLRADINFAAGRLNLELDKGMDQDRIIAQVDAVVHEVEDTACVLADQAGRNRVWQPIPWGRVYRLLAGVALFALAWLPEPGTVWRIGLFTTAWLVFGHDVLISAARNLRKKRIFDENFLMSIATLGALAIGEYPEAVAVMLFYQVGQLLQSLAVDRSRRSIRALMDLRPEQVTWMADGELITTDPQDLVPGDRMLVRPGERVALDCLVVEGETSLNTAALTGESMPRPVGPGDEVLAGCINGSGLLTLEIIRPFGESAVSRILAMVEEASARKAEAEQFITRFAKVYTPFMVGFALLLAIVPPIAGFGPFSEWVYRALVLLVISCPCALVISVPLGYFAGLGAASARGILVKGGAYLEKLAQISAVVFDKTGTLTEGRFTVTSIEPVAGWSEQDVLRLAALAESHSSHPIADSLARACREKGIILSETADSIHYQDMPGRGVSAVIGGKRVLVGNIRLMQDQQVDVPKTKMADEALSMSVLYCAVDGRHAARFWLSDQIKAGVSDFIADLSLAGVKKTALLSGDRLQAVRLVADQAGVSDYTAELLPEQKVAALEKIISEQGSEGSVVYVGDGINDAPVLARADVGIALGAGSDAAIESADVVVIGDDLNKITQAITIARRTSLIIRQNITMALGFKAIVMILAVAGLAGIWLAVFADVGVTLQIGRAHV